MISNLLLPHNLYSGVKHIPLSSQRPFHFHYSYWQDFFMFVASSGLYSFNTPVSLLPHALSANNPLSFTPVTHIPHFSNCMQNDVTSVRRCWTSFRKKEIVYYYSWDWVCFFKKFSLVRCCKAGQKQIEDTTRETEKAKRIHFRFDQKVGNYLKTF